jgi:NTP pyrophosphatase (non-canonical NTP hydrolase)
MAAALDMSGASSWSQRGVTGETDPFMDRFSRESPSPGHRLHERWTGGILGGSRSHYPGLRSSEINMTVQELQDMIEQMYSSKDRERGSAGTFMWLTEEIGELAAAIMEGSQKDKEGEFADVLAWIVTLANIENVNLTQAIHAKYGEGCPGCDRMVCTCNTKS